MPGGRRGGKVKVCSREKSPWKNQGMGKGKGMLERGRPLLAPLVRLKFKELHIRTYDFITRGDEMGFGVSVIARE